MRNIPCQGCSSTHQEETEHDSQISQCQTWKMVRYEEIQEYQYHLEGKLFKICEEKRRQPLEKYTMMPTKHTYIVICTYIYIIYIYINLQACLLHPSPRYVMFFLSSHIKPQPRFAPPLLSGPHSTCFCHAPLEHWTPQVESIWEWMSALVHARSHHMIFETKTNDVCLCVLLQLSRTSEHLW